MTYYFICKLKDIDFNYKVNADNITEAKVKLRNHIKNAVEISEFFPEPKKESNEFINFFNDMINGKP